MLFRFSRQLHPIFDAASEALKDESQIVFGRVDCDKESAICKEFQVNKVRIKRFIFHSKAMDTEQKSFKTIICCRTLRSKENEPMTQVLIILFSIQQFDYFVTEKF